MGARLPGRGFFLLLRSLRGRLRLWLQAGPVGHGFRQQGHRHKQTWSCGAADSSLLVSKWRWLFSTYTSLAPCIAVDFILLEYMVKAPVAILCTQATRETHYSRKNFLLLQMMRRR